MERTRAISHLLINKPQINRVTISKEKIAELSNLLILHFVQQQPANLIKTPISLEQKVQILKLFRSQHLNHQLLSKDRATHLLGLTLWEVIKLPIKKEMVKWLPLLHKKLVTGKVTFSPLPNSMHLQERRLVEPIMEEELFMEILKAHPLGKRRHPLLLQWVRRRQQGHQSSMTQLPRIEKEKNYTVTPTMFPKLHLKQL